jgi:SAM-dependent methyltransferase
VSCISGYKLTTETAEGAEVIFAASGWAFGMNASTLPKMSNYPQKSKRGLQLDRVVLLGRTFEEYRRYFLLDPDRLVGRRVLDVAGGVSSFCAEGNKLGIKITAFDPIYSLSSEKIRQRSEPDLESVYQSIGQVPTYRWAFYKNPDHMRALRARACAIFFNDFQIHPERYVAGQLPRLPFANCEFDLTLVSYLLFAYQDGFDYEFHRSSLLEIMRVTREEARIYPTVTFEAQPSEYVPMLRADPALKQFVFTEVKTDFEFLVNSNSFLCVKCSHR